MISVANSSAIANTSPWELKKQHGRFSGGKSLPNETTCSHNTILLMFNLFCVFIGDNRLQDTHRGIRNPKAKFARAVNKLFTPKWPRTMDSAMTTMDNLDDKKQFYNYNTVHSNTLAYRGFTERREKSCLFSFV